MTRPGGLFSATARRRISAAFTALVIAALGYITAMFTGKGGSGPVVLNIGAGQTTNLYQQPAIERAVRRLTQTAFTARVSGRAETGVNWYVVEPDCGSITSDGRYTAPGSERTCHLVATSEGRAALTAVIVAAARGGIRPK